MSESQNGNLSHFNACAVDRTICVDKVQQWNVAVAFCFTDAKYLYVDVE